MSHTNRLGSESMKGTNGISHSRDLGTINTAQAYDLESNKPAAQPLTILIAGAGISGLTAAIAFRQEGHIVKIFEKSQFALELGAAVHLAPNCNGILRRLGIFAETFGSVPMNKLSEFDEHGTPFRTLDLREANKMWQHPWLLAHRVHLHDALKRAATSSQGPGLPTEMHLRSRVQTVDEALGTITLENGETVHGDIIVGADGVHSVTKSRIAPEIKAHGCGHSAFRFLIDRASITSDPVTEHFVRENGDLKVWFAKDRRLVMYPTSNNEIMNIAAIHPASESNAGSDWNNEASMETLLKVCSGFEPSVRALIAKADPKTLKCWTLLDMEEIPIWAKDRLALIGDAAHPFLPHQGQGAGVAMEDAAALSVVLPLGTTRAEIPERLQLYDSIRHERATKIQHYSRLLGSDDVLKKKKELDMWQFTNYNMGHDEFDNARQRFREYQWRKVANASWRSPIAFGPMPTPSRTQQPTFTTASIKFKTSRTLLQTLFPPSRAGYTFTAPGTIAYASFVQTTLSYPTKHHTLALHIHDVQYKNPRTSSTVEGTYIPIIFDSLADAVVSDREDHGLPKVHSSIDIHRRGNSYHVRMGWQGANWGSFSLTDLKQAESQVVEDVDGIIYHRYIPSFDREQTEGKALADHASFIPFAEAEQRPTVLQSWKAGRAKFDIDSMDRDSLPTLHHVIERLAELPVYEVMCGKLIEGVGMIDLAGAKAV